VRKVLLFAVFVLIVSMSSATIYAESFPKWIEKIFVWYEEGEISEDEMQNAIGWLVDKGILKDDTIYSTPKM
jgi:tRNA(Ser,Leu) C12 N-acetylase TAN1